MRPFDYHALASSQDQGRGVARHPENGFALRLEGMQIPGTDIKFYRDTCTPRPRLFTTTLFRLQFVDNLYELSHPGAIAT
jgi:hypothetical protein